MIRTQVQLEQKQAEALKRAAAEQGVSMAEIIRLALDRYLGEGGAQARRQRAIRMIGGFRSGHGDVSTDHDRHLAEAFGE